MRGALLASPRPDARSSPLASTKQLNNQTVAMLIHISLRRGLYAAALTFAAALFTAQSASAQPAVPAAVLEKAVAGKLVSLIVTTRPGHDASGEAAHHGGRVRRQLTAQTAAIEVDGGEVAQLSVEPGIEHVSLDLDVHSTAGEIATG